MGETIGPDANLSERITYESTRPPVVHQATGSRGDHRMNLTELRDAYAEGKLTEPMMMDNDEVFVYDADGEQVFSEDPGVLLHDALTLLGIPHEKV